MSPASLEEALAACFAGESVTGVKGRQNLEVKASKMITLERAPKVLTLHLKQFYFDPHLGPRKLARRVRYPLVLELPTRLMSTTLRKKMSEMALSYRLFTVVLHHGRNIHGGHYTAYVRDALGAWRHCDDQHVTQDSEVCALDPPSGGHPYLLFYALEGRQGSDGGDASKSASHVNAVGGPSLATTAGAGGGGGVHR
ncbi:unnamed protein product [Discosporangium mesarthrocarpum]